jgi:WD repeat-containing protein mio
VLSAADAGNVDSSYPELLQLVAMCVAGYVTAGPVPGGKGGAKGGGGGAEGLWTEMCESLLDRPQMQARSSISYVRAACAFLASIAEMPAPRTGWGSPDKARRTSFQGPEGLLFRRVLQDTELSLADRCAFACKFLPPRQLQAFLTKQGELCLEQGNVEGTLLFGLGKQGLGLLQAYVDRTGDIQTTALLCSRVLLPPTWGAERARVNDWIESYRELLNSQQLWHERALFDVGRANLLNETLRRRQKEAGGGGSTAGRDSARAQGTGAEADEGDGAEEVKGGGTREAQQRVGVPVTVVPPQLYVRCNYCNAGIQLNSLRRQGRMGQSWLSRQKPLLNCCPDCRKPLPRCYICLMPLGCLNPYLELKRQLQQNQQLHPLPDPAVQGDASTDLLDHDALASLSSVRFSEWFTWCQHCKHGGHAHHIMEWFETHAECGVSGCSCMCYGQDFAVLNPPARVLDATLGPDQSQHGAPPAGVTALPSPPLTN